MIGFLRSLLLVCCVLLSVTQAFGASADTRVANTLARIQVSVWVDMGAAGKALALSQMGVWQHPNDVSWWSARLEALQAADMDAWIEMEFRAEGARKAAKEAWMIHEAATGRRLAVPEAWQGLDAQAVRAKLALARGDTSLAEAFLTDFPHDRVAGEIRVALALAHRDEAELAALIDGWPVDGREALAPLAALAREGVLKGPVLASWQRLKKRVREVITTTPASPEALMQVGLWALQSREDVLLSAAAQALAQVRQDDPSDTARLLSNLEVAPDHFAAWELPLRARWSLEQLTRTGEQLARDKHPQMPWARPDEIREIAIAWAGALVKRKQGIAAERVISDWLGRCATGQEALRLAGNGEVTAALDSATADLIGCVAGRDAVPDRDPAGGDVGRRLDEVGDAWFAFAQVALKANRADVAALGFGIAARLTPDATHVTWARRFAGKLVKDPGGIPTVAALLQGIEGQTWLASRTRNTIARADRVRQITSAFLQPDLSRWLNLVTPQRSCNMLTMPRCGLERGRVAAAASHQGEPVPEQVRDPLLTDAALAAGSRWFDQLTRERFQRQSVLAGLTREDLSSDLDTFLRTHYKPKVGGQAPEWQVDMVSSRSLKGSVVVLLLWDHTAGRILPTMTALDALSAKWDREKLGVRTLSIGVDADRDAYRGIVSAVSVESMLITRDPAIAVAFGQPKLPALAVIDRDGVIRVWRPGDNATNLSELETQVRAWASIPPQRGE